ncbi:hypothetical protein BO78DRAFT_178395 [Aspergillus sclerotiicarbonarius CBS 121057]|uniref:Uncharacterized protein n=1 Tax=Aspergillus sclerotiicarbonarius (strain CBS 121057 / IBT 28362) TaxID=1448318 RepID=A0A319ECL1_ASPSB|nr:hypothetical protein BO78DRAFT_178395 [Aspergillus sclerotiicarbonarius CBS 121057]
MMTVSFSTRDSHVHHHTSQVENQTAQGIERDTKVNHTNRQPDTTEEHHSTDRNQTNGQRVEEKPRGRGDSAWR